LLLKLVLMKYYVLLLMIVCFQGVLAQAPAAPEPDNRKLTLEERFQSMKSKAESYQDYKVIKALTLDAEWKIFMDSIRANKSIWQDARRSIAAQQSELKNAKDAMDQKEASMSDIVYNSKHISFLGISFAKSTFTILVIASVVGLIVLVILLSGKLKLMNTTIHEKTDLAEVTMKEFEEYKHKALDKQTKLSRELQNERNKLAEMRHN
jgi:hypothetical protein